MAPLTRSETQRRNREHVLEVARRLFLRDGYAATSLAAVAEEAGISTGVVYSNFSGKSGLALAVLREIEAEQIERLTSGIAAAGNASDKLAVFDAWAEDALTSGWPRLELDFALDHRDDPELVLAEGRRHESLVRLIVAEIGPLLPESLRTPAVEHAVADAVMNLAIGSAVRRIIDPKATVSELLGVLRALVSGSLT